MPDPEKGYEPSPAEIRVAEASMSDVQREHTDTREDALFEGKSQVAEGQNSEVVEESQNEARESAEVDYVEQYKHLKDLGIDQDAEGLMVLRTSGEWDGGWYVASMDTLFGRILMKKHEGNEVLTKKFSYDEAEEYIRAGAKAEQQPPEPETPTPTTPEAKVEFRNIPLKDGRIINGEILSGNISIVTIMTQRGKIDVSRHMLLYYDDGYSRGDAADLDAIDAYQKKKKQEEERANQAQSPPRHMSSGA